MQLTPDILSFQDNSTLVNSYATFPFSPITCIFPKVWRPSSKYLISFILVTALEISSDDMGPPGFTFA